MTGPMPYGLTRPTVDDARASVLRVHQPDGQLVWDRLVHAAGTSDDLERLLDLMEAADPVTRTCALASRIRVITHTHLAAAHTVPGS